jgi:hypothetical protein
MLLQPSGGSSREPDLPLDTPEQIEYSLAVDAALESRAERQKREAEAGSAQFRSWAERVVFFVGLLLTVILCCCGLDLWVTGEAVRASAAFGVAGTIGGGSWMLIGRRAGSSGR